MNFKRFSILLIILLLLAGCGRKGPVQPLRQPLPAAPEALMVQQLGMRFLVAWNLPRSNQDGSPLTDLEGFRVFKMRYDLAQDCPECRDTSVLLLEVDTEYLREVRRVGDRLFLWDDEVEAGFGYQYSVVPHNRKGRDGEAVRLRVPFVQPPAAPAGLAAESRDRLVRLRWQAVAAGEDLLGYNLYRRKADEPFPLAPQNREVLSETAFEDFDVENGQNYVYAVRTVVRSLGERVESTLSGPAQATPQAGL